MPATDVRASSPDRLDGGEGGRPIRPILRARRTFRTGDQLFYLFEVFGVGGAASAVAGSYRLRKADGPIVREGPKSVIAPSADGRIVRLVGFPLEGLPPGGYELVISVDETTSGRTLERSEGFQLVAGSP